MNERWIRELMWFIDHFESAGRTVAEAHATLHATLALLDPHASPTAFDAVELAESEVEEIEQARLLIEQRPQTVQVLRDLRAALTTELEVVGSD